MSYSVGCLLAGLVVGTLPAQVFVVDASGGSGSHFTEIQAAVNTVPDGATLQVRSGVYAGFVIDQKELTVLADAGVLAIGGAAVQNLTANQQVTLRGIGVGPGFLGGGGITCSSNLGSVLLDSCDLSMLGSAQGGSLSVYGSVDVRMRSCMVATTYSMGSYPPALNCFDSRVTLSQCTLESPGNHGINAFGSTVVVADCTILGSGSQSTASVFLVNSTLRGLGATTLTALGSSGAVINGTGSARLAPSVALVGSGLVTIGAGVAAATQAMPVVTAETQPAGGQATASLEGPVGGLGVLFVGLPGPLLSVAGVQDPVAMQFGTESSATAGVLATPLTSGYTVPPLASSLGIRIAWQGVSWDPLFDLQISNVVTYVHY